MNNLTENKNFLSPTGFRLSIDSTKFANTEYFCISAPLPTLSLNPIAVNFRGQQAIFPGDKIDYGQIDIRFIVNEDMDNYIEMFNWIQDCTKTTNTKDISHDIIMSIMTSKNNVNKQIRFVSAMPVSLDGMEFTVQNTDIEYLTASVTFQYTRFEFVK